MCVENVWGTQAGWTPLMVAAGNGHTAFMRFLLDEGCEAGIASESGECEVVVRVRRVSQHSSAAVRTMSSPIRGLCGNTVLRIHDKFSPRRLEIRDFVPRWLVI